MVDFPFSSSHHQLSGRTPEFSPFFPPFDFLFDGLGWVLARRSLAYETFLSSPVLFFLLGESWTIPVGVLLFLSRNFSSPPPSNLPHSARSGSFFFWCSLNRAPACGPPFQTFLPPFLAFSL